MAGVVHNLKRWFGKSEAANVLPSFRQTHFLNSMTDQQLSDLFQFVEQKHFLEVAPEIISKNILFLSHASSKLILERVAKMAPQQIINYQLEPFIPPKSGRLFSVNGNLRSLAVRSSFFDTVFMPVASCFRKDFMPSMAAISKTLANGGRAVFSFIHPTVELLLTNQNPSSPVRTSNSLQNYFNVLRENNFYLETLTEGVVDKETRPFFLGPAGEGSFDEYRGIPLVLFLRVVKYMKNS